MSGRARDLSARRLFVLALLGILLVQAAWVLTVPPFKGLDEHDHAFKAGAAARGDLRPGHEVSPQGWGSFMSVPEDLVEAAEPVCRTFAYTTDDNCEGRGADGPDTVRAATVMADLNPVFYVVVGTAARPFDGVTALYVMRATTALLCAVLIGLSLVALRTWARTSLLAAGTTLALTPVLVYSTAVAAPNGPEMACGLLVWTSLLGALSGSVPLRTREQLVRFATVGAVPLVTMRSFGPIWLLLIVATAMAWSGVGPVRELLTRRTTRVSVAVVVAATLLAGLWLVLARPDYVPTTDEGAFTDSLWSVIPQQWVLWFVQSVAAIPARDEILPLPLYAVAFSCWWVVTLMAVRRAKARQRWSLLLLFVLATAVPAASTAYFYETIGTAWQGRYGLPYTVGFFVMCAAVLDARAADRAGSARAVSTVLVALFGLLQAVALVSVLHRQEDHPDASTWPWAAPPSWLLVALALAGTALLLVALVRHVAPPSSAPRAVAEPAAVA